MTEKQLILNVSSRKKDSNRPLILNDEEIYSLVCAVNSVILDSPVNVEMIIECLPYIGNLTSMGFHPIKVLKGGLM